jgi:hypothetical protein
MLAGTGRLAAVRNELYSQFGVVELKVVESPTRMKEASLGQPLWFFPRTLVNERMARYAWTLRNTILGEKSWLGLLNSSLRRHP